MRFNVRPSAIVTVVLAGSSLGGCQGRAPQPPHENAQGEHQIAPCTAGTPRGDDPRPSIAGDRVDGPASSNWVSVSGHVRDEGGGPVSGANVSLRVQDRNGLVIRAVTDASGAFSAKVPMVPQLWISASHDEFGTQWSGSGAVPGWTEFQRLGPTPEGPVDLVLRRGVVLYGRVLDAAGRAFAGDAVFVVPAYVGSGPARIEAATDSRGCFTFERMVLSRFELVPRSLDHWRPRQAGDHLRIAQRPDAWLEAARLGDPVDVQLEPYTLVPVSIDVTALRTSSVQVWKRWGTDSSEGTALEVDAKGRVQTVMERGKEYELWVFGGTARSLNAPWSRGIRRSWSGTPDGPLELTLPAPIP
jgi:hypothetical protein